MSNKFSVQQTPAIAPPTDTFSPTEVSDTAIEQSDAHFSAYTKPSSLVAKAESANAEHLQV